MCGPESMRPLSPLGCLVDQRAASHFPQRSGIPRAQDNPSKDMPQTAACVPSDSPTLFLRTNFHGCREGKKRLARARNAWRRQETPPSQSGPDFFVCRISPEISSQLTFRHEGYHFFRACGMRYHATRILDPTPLGMTGLSPVAHWVRTEAGSNGPLVYCT